MPPHGTSTNSDFVSHTLLSSSFPPLLCTLLLPSPPMRPTMQPFRTYLRYVALISAGFALPPVGRKALATVKRCQVDTNVLMFVAAVGAILLGDFTEAAAVAFLFGLSEWLEGLSLIHI